MNYEDLEQTINQPEPTPDNVDSTQSYIEAINTIKKNSVPVEEYNKLKKQNQQLLDTIVNGGDAPVPDDPYADIKDEDLFNTMLHSNRNIDVIKASLELRRRAIAKGEPDPYLPQSRQYEPTQSDYEGVDRVVKAFESAIELAEDNESVFNAEMQRISPLIFKNKK